MLCLSGMKGVKKQADFIKEGREINTRFLMIRDGSAPILENV